MKFPKYRRGMKTSATRTEYPAVKLTPRRLVIAIFTLALVVACGAGAHTLNTIATEQQQQNAIVHHWLSVQPLPTFSGNSQIRQNLIEIEHAEVVGAQTTTFECGSLGGCDPTHPPIKSCASVGAPIPVTDQLSNPMQPEADTAPPLNDGGGNITIGNMDPNGVYPGGGSGTYVQCIEAGGAIIPSYWEGDVQVEFAPAVWEQGKGIVDTGPPSFQFTR